MAGGTQGAFYSPLTNTQGYGLSAPITASGIVKTGAGNVQGIIVSSHTNGTIKLWDNTAGSGTIVVDTYTYATGSQFIPLFGARFLTGLYADINSTTQKVTIVYN